MVPARDRLDTVFEWVGVYVTGRFYALRKTPCDSRRCQDGLVLLSFVPPGGCGDSAPWPVVRRLARQNDPTVAPVSAETQFQWLESSGARLVSGGFQ
jgi:hypothetical protein